MHTILVLEDDIELNNTICYSLGKMVIGLWELELVKKQKTTQIVIPFTWQFWISIWWNLEIHFFQSVKLSL